MDKINELIDGLHLKISKNRISIREISRRTGVSQSMVSKVLDGQGKVDALKKILDCVSDIVEKKR